MNQTKSWQDTLQTSVYLLLFIILLGWLLKIGQSFLLPILIAIISMYILTTLTNWMGKFPLLKSTPTWARHLIVLVGFSIFTLLFSRILMVTGEQILASAPVYQSNLERIIQQFASQYGWAQYADWSLLKNFIFERINMQSVINYMITAVSSFTSMLVFVIVYTMFLIAEKSNFATKLSIAFKGESATKTMSLMGSINQKIGDYLAVKTLINIILAILSVIILWGCGVEHAIFWALIIGILNYIPYIGSLIGVIFPVLLALVQFGSLQLTIVVAVLLTIAQMYTGNILEPKMIGKQINLSPFVVLVSLSFWSLLWGISGAILAVPLTSIFVIILKEFESTQPFTLLLVDKIYDEDTKE